MLWLVLLLLMAVLSGLWWRLALPDRAARAVVPPVLTGNHASLRTRHYRLADFADAPVVPAAVTAAPAPGPASDSAPDPAPAAHEPAPPQPSAPADDEPAAEPGQLPAGAHHNYLADPAPTATDEHNRGVELTAAQRRAKMRSVMNAALENRRAAPA